MQSAIEGNYFLPVPILSWSCCFNEGEVLHLSVMQNTIQTSLFNEANFAEIKRLNRLSVAERILSGRVDGQQGLCESCEGVSVEAGKFFERIHRETSVEDVFISDGDWDAEQKECVGKSKVPGED